MSPFSALQLLVTISLVSGSSLSARQSCTDATYFYCSATSGGSSGGSSGGGSSGGNADANWIGDGAIITGLYNGGSYIKRSLQRRQDAVCCPTGYECGTITDDNIPACYDATTTNFILPDGSYGYTNTGMYYDTEGNTYNLETGDYTLATGTVGNVFVDNGEAPPAGAINTGNANSPVSTGAAGGGTNGGAVATTAGDGTISKPVPTGTVNEQVSPNKDSGASSSRRYGGSILALAGALALVVVL